MSEQKTNYMAQLDAWTDEVIIEPLTADLGGVVGVEMQLQIRRAIRDKVLESYRNGCKAGAGHVRREMNPSQRVDGAIQRGLDGAVTDMKARAARKDMGAQAKAAPVHQSR